MMNEIEKPHAVHKWVSCSVQEILNLPNSHVLHSYFNASPESPDGRYVLYFVSSAADAHRGDLCIIDRLTGEVDIIDAGIEVEDAHRQANQQWVAEGRFIVYMRITNKRWEVVRWDTRIRVRTIMATDRQPGWGQAHLSLVPLYGIAANPGDFGDLEMLDVESGKIRNILLLEQVKRDHQSIIASLFGEHIPDSLFFPVLSPDGQKIFFKLSASLDGKLRSDKSSTRRGLFGYNILTKQTLHHDDEWRHPTWHPGSEHIINTHQIINIDSGVVDTIPWYPRHCNTHPAVSPDGTLLCIDGRRAPITGTDLHWAVVVGDFKDAFHIIHEAPGSEEGTTSWRKPHPHPVFNHDGTRIYFNVKQGSWMTLMVAELPS